MEKYKTPIILIFIAFIFVGLSRLSPIGNTDSSASTNPLASLLMIFLWFLGLAGVILLFVAAYKIIKIGKNNSK